MELPDPAPIRILSERATPVRPEVLSPWCKDRAVAGHDAVVEPERRRRVEQLYDQYADDVHAYARRRSNANVADDVVMEVFVVACRRLEDVPNEALPWLLGCARRTLANHRRGTARAGALADRLSDAAGSAGVDATQASEVGAALAQMTDRDRELLLLMAWEGLDLGEVAKVVGCSRGAAGVRLHRARRRLRQLLERNGEVGERQGPEVAR